MSDSWIAFLALCQRLQGLFGRNFNEAETRVYLIDPVLGALSYEGPDDIRMEVPLPATKEFIDYELLVDGNALVIVEAKALKQAITDQAAGQCVGYAVML